MSYTVCMFLHVYNSIFMTLNTYLLFSCLNNYIQIIMLLNFLAVAHVLTCMCGWEVMRTILLQDKNDMEFTGKQWPGIVVFPDYFNNATSQYWADQVSYKYL